MRIVCDDKIPYIREALERLADDVIYKPGKEICRDDVYRADALIVRTRTRCDASLLKGSSVQIVVTATIGYDHLDTEWLDQAGIRWANCPGCNASSVAQWVRNSLIIIEEKRGVSLKDMTLGIVGYGHVGKQVEKALKPYVAKILVNDPPLYEHIRACPHHETTHSSNILHEATASTGLACNIMDLPEAATQLFPLSELQRQADVITFHTPLTRNGPYPTYHLAGNDFFSSLAHPVILVNAARGGVVDEHCLLQAMNDGRVTDAIIDTWENEPDINRDLLRRATIATPHVAGYSADGKANASRMAVKAIYDHFYGQGRENVYRQLYGTMRERHETVINQEACLSTIVPPPLPDGDYASPLSLYDPRQDTASLKTFPERFEWFRGNYPIRREAAHKT